MALELADKKSLVAKNIEAMYCVTMKQLFTLKNASSKCIVNYLFNVFLSLKNLN